MSHERNCESARKGNHGLLRYLLAVQRAAEYGVEYEGGLGVTFSSCESSEASWLLRSCNRLSASIPAFLFRVFFCLCLVPTGAMLVIDVVVMSDVIIDTDVVD